MVNFGAGRSHGVGEGAVVLFDAAAAGVLFCTLSTVAIASIDLTALLQSCSIGFSQLRRIFITTGLRITGISCERPVMGLWDQDFAKLILSESTFRSSSSVQRAVLMLTL